MGLFPGAIDEELRVKALAHQASLHVDLAGQNRIDAAFGNILLQVFKRIARAHCKKSRA